MTDKPKRRWYQFSLRTLFIITTLFAIPCSWYAYEMNEAAKRRAAIEKIEKLGGEVIYYDATDPFTSLEPARWYSWLRRLHGDVHLGNVTAVAWLSPAKHVTDADLVHLKGLTNLTDLWLDYTQITDAGLVHLEGLTNLEELFLHGTQIGDAGLVHLEGLTNLTGLWLQDTQVTDEGVKKLQEALPNCRIYY